MPGAIAAATEAVSRAPFYAQPHWQLGNLLIRAGHHDAGFSELRLAAESDPELLTAVIDLAWHLAGDKPESVLRAIQPHSPEEYKALAEYFQTEANGTYSVDLQVLGATFRRTHTLIVFADSTAAPAVSVRHNDPSSWWSQTAGADYVIVTTRDLKANVEPLAQLRRNQGLVVKVIDVEDLYDEFSFWQHSPQAIHDLLQTASSSWTRKPHYLLLAGDASYDPKNYFGQGLNDLVPTKLIDTALMEAASDDWLADFNGDGMADLAIGRLPVRTAADINTMVGKIVNYENTAPDPPGPTSGALLVADTSFEAQSSAVQSLLPAGMAVETINRGSTDDATAHNQIIAGLNQGPAWQTTSATGRTVSGPGRRCSRAMMRLG